MNALEATLKAKDVVAKIFADEGPFNIALEEVKHDGDLWVATISFSRKWDSYAGNIQGLLKPSRISKYVKLNELGDLVEIKNADPPF